MAQQLGMLLTMIRISPLSLDSEACQAHPHKTVSRKLAELFVQMSLAMRTAAKPVKAERDMTCNRVVGEGQDGATDNLVIAPAGQSRCRGWLSIARALAMPYTSGRPR